MFGFFLLASFVFGLSLGQNPECSFTLFLPQGCGASEMEDADYAVANFSFVSDSDSLSIANVNGLDRDFCHKKDIWTMEDEGCIVLNATKNFSEGIKCPEKNVILLSGEATFHPDSVFRTSGEESKPTKYNADSTGLLIHCEAAYPLNITVDLNGEWPYLGILVTLGQFPLTLDSNANPLKMFSGKARFANIGRRFWLKAKIPPKFSGTQGNIQKYAGNYTISSVSNPNLKTKFQIEIERRNDKIKVSSGSPCGETEEKFVEICQLRAHCNSPSIAEPGVKMYFANIGGSNPTETRISNHCLEKDSLCEGKLLGAVCSEVPGCRLLEEIYPNGVLRCDDGQTVEDVAYFHGLDFGTYTIFSHEALRPQSVIKLKEDNGRNLTTWDDIEKEENDPDFQNKTILVYQKEMKRFKCQFVPYVIIRPIYWILTHLNGTESLIHLSKEEEEGEEMVEVDRVVLQFPFVFIDLKMAKDILSLECRASFWNTAEFQHSNIISFNVQESTPPKFLTSRQPTQTVEFGKKFTITCGNATGQPEPTYTWKINNVAVNESDTCIKPNGKPIEICAAGPQYDGKFTCTASNFLSSDFQEIPVKVEKVETNAWIYFGVACGIILILIPILFLLFRLYSRTRRRLSYFEIEAFEKGNIKELKTDKFAHENAQFLPYNKDYEILSTNFEIYEDQVLGQGAYGIVMKARINRDKTAAVKTVLPDADKATVLSLLSELKIMIYLGKHSHVVELLGANTEQLKNGCPFIFVEFCQLGNLESFIRKNRDDFIARRKRGEDVGISYENIQPKDNDNDDWMMSTETFFRWSIQISDGMAYLAGKKVIHGDLAIRNVLLVDVEHVKITDFGLSRQLMNSSAYVKKQQQLLPWRHMALESLQGLIFTSKSDVWSFGVTMYEIFSLGQIPYGGMSWTIEFVEKLEADLRLPMPPYGNLELYGIMLKCWIPDPKCRPDFVQLRMNLETVLNELLTNTNTSTNPNATESCE